MKLLAFLFLSLLFASCSSLKYDTAFESSHATDKSRKVASIVDTEQLRISQAFSRSSMEAAFNVSQTRCLNSGGRVLKSSAWTPEELGMDLYQVVTICLMNGDNSGPTRVNKDTNAQFCYIRSNPEKCEEIGACQWIAKTRGSCGARPGFDDTNTKFCYLRSNPNKCEEISSCVWNQGTGGFCKARD